MLLAGAASGPVWSQSLGAYPFTLGVASGDPAPDGFVIWTRLAIRPLQPVGGMDRIAYALYAQVKPAVMFEAVVRALRKTSKGVKIE